MESKYNIGSYKFEVYQFFPEDLFYKITDLRLTNIHKVLPREYENRIRRNFPSDSNLVIIAADHPARRVTKVGSNELAMGNRHEYLGRIIRVLMLDQVDGIMTTPDIMDDLVLFNYIFKKMGGKSFIDNKILIGSTNRGGLLGSPYEMYDPITAYNIDDIKKLGLDGAKMMIRIDLESKFAKYSQKTLKICSDLIRKCNQYAIPAFIEALPVHYTDKGIYKVKKNSTDLIKTIGIVTALGGNSANIWLKVPYVDNFKVVSKSTTNPMLILGGESTGNPLDFLKNIKVGLESGQNVKGCLAGRNILYPGNDDPRAISLGVSNIIHGFSSVEEAFVTINKSRGKEMDFLISKIT
ncbi:MAG: class I fructose-bisphosphate aldolase [Candidatus Hodarchaeota archaeon]